MGHSGQSVDDILRQTAAPAKAVGDGDGAEKMDTDEKENAQPVQASALSTLRNTLIWGHLAPTCPGKSTSSATTYPLNILLIPLLPL